MSDTDRSQNDHQVKRESMEDLEDLDEEGLEDFDEDDLDNEELDGLHSGETDVLVDALLSHALTVRGPDLSLSRRVVDRADAIAFELGLDESQRSVIRKAAVLRDVGRAGIPDTILKKSGPLTDSEYREVQKRLLPENDADDSEPVRVAIQIAYHHHERFDGDGYPNKLKGAEIPHGARILSAAEAYETMMMDAPYRPARSPHDALEEVVAESGSQFDPDVVEALKRTVLSGKPGWSSRRLSKNRPDYLGRTGE